MTPDNNHSSDTSQEIKFIQLKHQQFAEKQKILFYYHLKKILTYTLLVLMLFLFSKILLRISDVFASQLSYFSINLIPPTFTKPINKTVPNSPPVKADVDRICIALYKNGEHPGVIQNNACVIAYGSKAISLPHYKKLAKGNYDWIRFHYWTNIMPNNVVLAGQEPIVDRVFDTDPYQSVRNLYICRDAYNADYIGKVVDGVCNYTIGQKSRQADVYDLLVWGNKG
jgi:hypothetical protein